MEVRPLELYSEASNYAVVRMPGRNYPGCVIQGDSLASLVRTARRAVQAGRASGVEGEELLGNLEDLHDALLGRLLEYQDVILQAGFDLPYTRPATREDFVRLTQRSDSDEARP